MSLPPGTKLGPYEIVSALGAGGMGEVYRAKDSKLKREVAIKVLPPDVANDRERLARFQREAEVLASLNHPHIAHLYGIEESTPAGAPYTALVMELVEGEDLSQRIARGAIPIDEALPIARQIVEALECAHEQGIIHRDLKPANIKVRPDGTVKVLDFGLAKALDPGSALAAPGSGSLANSPTITSPAMTMRGMILGTAAYMAPEQAKGRVVDKRADIWAFGCVLYEMLTGRRAFHGEDATDTIAEVLKSNVNYNALPPSTPSNVRRLMVRCLQREPKLRLRDIGDARTELMPDMPGETAPVARKSGLSYGTAAVLVVFAAAIAAGGAWLLNDGKAVTPPQVIRTAWPFGTGNGLRLGLQQQQIAISHRGRTVAVLGTRSVLIRQPDHAAWTTIPNSEDITGVFGSPDGQWVGFMTRRDLGKMRAAGGPRVPIGQLANTLNTGAQSAFWADDNRVYFTDGFSIYAVPADGGTVQTLVTGTAYSAVTVLPGSRDLVVSEGFAQANPSIVLKSLDGGKDVALGNGLSPRFIAPDLLFYVRAGTLVGVHLDITNRRLAGEPVALVEQVATLGTSAQFDISDNGTLVYLPASSSSEGQSTLRLKTPRGTLGTLSSTVRAYSDPRLSPDGRRLALHLFDQDNDIWVFDVARGALSRLSFDPREDETPVWSPDGQWIAYAGYVPGGADRAVMRRRADGSGAEEVLMKSPTHSHVTDWSPDGKWLLIESVEVQRRSDIAMLNTADRTVTVLMATPFSESAARLSPDGKWMAYHSDESGRMEVYIRSFPSLEGKVQVSTGGGEQPVWARDGKSVYFRTATDIARAAVTSDGSMQVSSPVTLFADNFLRPQAVNHTTYEVMPNGDVLVFDVTGDVAAPAAIIGVFNWLEEVRPKLRQ